MAAPAPQTTHNAASARANLVHNERVKLLANALNTTGIAVSITGGVAPTVGAFYGTLANVPGWWLLLVASCCFMLGVGLHVFAQVALGRLRDV